MYNNGNSSKNVTGSSVVDGTLENADYADNGLSGDKIDGGIISNFQSTGIDDRLPTGKILTLSTTGVDVDGAITCDGFTSTGIDDNATSTAITIDASESVGVGTASPDSALHVYKQTNDRTARFQRLGGQYVDMYQTSGINSLRSIGKNFEISTEDAQSLLFATNGSERMRIDNTGNINFGAGWEKGFDFYASGGSNQGRMDQKRLTTGRASTFTVLNTTVGSIDFNTASTSYNTSSDYRLKENVVPMVGSIDRLKALKPSRFNFISNPLEVVDGFLAHEAGAVVPECESGTKDAMKQVGTIKDSKGVIIRENASEEDTPEGYIWTLTASVPDYQGIDQSKLVPLLVAALQEAVARIEVLETS